MALRRDLEHTVYLGADNRQWIRFQNQAVRTQERTPVNFFLGVTRIVLELASGDAVQPLLDTTDLDGNGLVTRSRGDGWLGFRLGLAPAAPQPSTDWWAHLKVFQGPGDLSPTQLLHKEDPVNRLLLKFRRA